MHTTGKIDDRVFGMSDRLPQLPIVTRESHEFDLMTVSVDGAEVAYAQQGRLALPPLVLLHGWAASHRFWKYCFHAFSPRWRVIAPDLAGFGISEKPDRDYTPAGYASWLGRFLDALKLDRVTLVGHSMGGTISLLYALDHPERIEKLIVSNPVVAGASAFNSKTRFSMKWGIRTALFYLNKIEAVRRWVARDFTYVGKLDPSLAEDITRGTYQSTFDSALALAKLDLRPRLSTLAVPTYTIGTDHDDLVAPDQYAMVPAHGSVCIPDTGHVPMIERPAEFNRVLGEFLALP